jgi:hypothetical protein
MDNKTKWEHVWTTRILINLILEFRKELIKEDNLLLISRYDDFFNIDALKNEK